MADSSPPWLDRFFLTQVVQSMEGVKKELEVVKYECQPAVPRGTNYLSQLYRVSVKYKTEQAGNVKSISFIVKTPLESGEMKKFLERGNGYERECNIYNKVLPKLYEQQDARVTAKLFPCSLDNTLVLEDLCLKGYRIADRLKQLDVRHCQLFMESLSKLHALSYVVHRNSPELIEGVGRNLFYNNDLPDNEQKQMRSMNEGLLRVMADTVSTIDGCVQYVEKINRQIGSYWDRMIHVLKHKGELNVLIHGDTWTNNLLFKYNQAGEVVDAKLVDFQYAQFGSFSLDIIYFWWTSANENVREHHREQLFEVYRENLNKTLHELKCNKTLSKQVFDQEMKATALFSLCVMSTVLGVAMADPDDLLDFNEINSDDFTKDFNKKNLKSKYYKMILPKMLQQVEQFGAFD